MSLDSKLLKPNFFIVGAPRCGTTAMSSYLAEHPAVCFSDPKEPLYFCSDLPGLRYVENEKDYLEKCFDQSLAARSEAVGEGSVWYLYSSVAIPRIVEFQPDARFIVMLRNPLDMLSSLHQKLYFFLDENEVEFSKAWDLQWDRAEGVRVPDACREPKILQYAQIGRLGEQLNRLVKLVPASRIHIIFYEDFKADPGRVYRNALRFLSVSDDGRAEFPVVNENQRVRSRYFWEKATNPPGWMLVLARVFKSSLSLSL